MSPLLTVEQLCTQLQLSKAAIYAMVRRRELPYLRVGRRLRFSSADISNWLESKKVKPVLVEDEAKKLMYKPKKQYKIKEI